MVVVLYRLYWPITDITSELALCGNQIIGLTNPHRKKKLIAKTDAEDAGSAVVCRQLCVYLELNSDW